MSDVVVIGGGIAGISVAARLSESLAVTLVEQESVLAYHTTGRSAALFFENYGSSAIRPLTRVSKHVMLDPPAYVDAPLLSDRGALYMARPDQLESLENVAADDPDRSFVRIDGAEVERLQPCVRPGHAAAGLYDADARDIDVAGLHQMYVRWFRARGGSIETSAPAIAIEKLGGGWEVSTSSARLACDVVVNAAGAWGDRVAELAGVEPIGLRPLRRTAFMVGSDPALAHTPLVADMDFEFYFKPDGPQMLCSLAEEIEDEPGDARPREEDVALAIDRINAATTLAIRHVRSQWTGLRTFTPDGAPATGFDPDHPGFFWLVGQGGTGIQTAPGAAELAASLIVDQRPSAALLDAGLELEALSPARFR